MRVNSRRPSFEQCCTVQRCRGSTPALTSKSRTVVMPWRCSSSSSSSQTQTQTQTCSSLQRRHLSCLMSVNVLERASARIGSTGEVPRQG